MLLKRYNYARIACANGNLDESNSISKQTKQSEPLHGTIKSNSS